MMRSAGSIVFVGILFGCAGPLKAQSTALDDVISWTGELRLQETADGLVAAPRLRIDPLGGWLYWDTSENQARRYDQAGRLQVSMGRAGDGPGEFQRLRSLVHLDDGRFVTVDARGRVGVWSSSGKLEADFDSGLLDVTGAEFLAGPQILVGVRPRPGTDGRATPMLHVLNVDRREVAGSFFRLAIDSLSFTAVVTVEAPAPRRWKGQVAVSLGVLDTLWLLPEGNLGATPNTMSVPSSLMALNPKPFPTRAGGMAGFTKWMDQSAILGDSFRLRDGGVLIGTWGLRDGKPWRALLNVTASGRPAWEVKSTWQLLAVDDEDNLYFWDPEGMEPSRIGIARLRPQ